MATLKDVAKLACVDVSTVSRALNNTSYVHPETKARILAAVKELSYQPNVLAQGLRQGKRHTIGVVVPRLNFTIFAEVVQGVEEAAGKRGYATLICTTEEDAQVERDRLNRLRNGFIDGLIVTGTGKNGRLIRDIHASGLPIVQAIRCQESGISSVIGDYQSCGYEAVYYLARKGCKHIGLINGTSELSPYRERMYGYQRAMQELHLEECSTVPFAQENSFEYGYQRTMELLDECPELDGIMAAVDVHGLGAIRALKERGRRVPEQVRVISLTGHSVGAMLETTMTAMEFPAHEMGMQAANMLMDAVEAPSDAKPSPQRLVFSASLAEREST
ncbi:MAG: LacI family transcriptional regulator [Clostridiales bacterium]|nr:LacI family transcriptional regulator [Clostridiales bacterium]